MVHKRDSAGPRHAEATIKDWVLSLPAHPKLARQVGRWAHPSAPAPPRLMMSLLHRRASPGRQRVSWLQAMISSWVAPCSSWRHAER